MKYAGRILCIALLSIAASALHGVAETSQSTETQKVQTDGPPDTKFNRGDVPREQFFWDGKKWIDIQGTSLMVWSVRLDDEMGTIAYGDSDARFLYVWKGVRVSVKTGLFDRKDGKRIVMDLRYATPEVREIDPPLQFYKDTKGEFHPGYFDWDRQVFYEWKNVTVPKEKIPHESPEHRSPVVEKDKPKGFHFQIVEIEIPTHQSAMVKQWTVEPKQEKR
jgi:hypothetical protein